MRVEINGSVMSGCGLEPCSSDRFTMIEKTEEDTEYYNDNSDDDDIPDLGADISEWG